MVVAEIVDGKGLRVDLVHGAGGIGHGGYLVGVVFLPPVQGGGDVHGDKDLADVFPVVAAGSAEPLCQIQIVGSQDIISIFIVGAVHPSPAVHGVSGAADSVFQVHDACALKFYHMVDSPLLAGPEPEVLYVSQSLIPGIIIYGNEKTIKYKIVARTQVWTGSGKRDRMKHHKWRR